MNESKSHSSEAAAETSEAFGKRIRPVDQDQPSPGFQERSGGAEPFAETARGQHVSAGAAALGRGPDPADLEEGRVRHHDVRGFGNQAGSSAFTAWGLSTWVAIVRPAEA